MYGLSDEKMREASKGLKEKGLIEENEEGKVGLTEKGAKEVEKFGAENTEMALLCLFAFKTVIGTSK